MIFTPADEVAEFLASLRVGLSQRDAYGEQQTAFARAIGTDDEVDAGFEGYPSVLITHEILQYNLSYQHFLMDASCIGCEY